jgi:hypothetical protein
MQKPGNGRKGRQPDAAAPWKTIVPMNDKKLIRGKSRPNRRCFMKARNAPLPREAPPVAAKGPATHLLLFRKSSGSARDFRLIRFCVRRSAA